jgi:phytoene desaturase
MWILSACKDIYDAPQWPKEPLFYANFPSLDKTAAPEGMESGFFLFRWHLELMTRRSKRYFNKIIDRFEHLTQQSVKNNIIFKFRFVKMILLKTIIHTREMLTE